MILYLLSVGGASPNDVSRSQTRGRERVGGYRFRFPSALQIARRKSAEEKGTRRVLFPGSAARNDEGDVGAARGFGVQ